jgi:hypothetical protein
MCVLAKAWAVAVLALRSPESVHAAAPSSLACTSGSSRPARNQIRNPVATLALRDFDASLNRANALIDEVMAVFHNGTADYVQRIQMVSVRLTSPRAERCVEAQTLEAQGRPFESAANERSLHACSRPTKFTTSACAPAAPSAGRSPSCYARARVCVCACARVCSELSVVLSGRTYSCLACADIRNQSDAAVAQVRACRVLRSEHPVRWRGG